jgi:undecaprenyl-diphosphatase
VASTAAPLLVIWLVLVALLVLLGELVKHSPSINSLDRRITTWVVGQRTPALNELMKIITWAGSWIAVAVLAVATLTLVLRRRLALLAVVMVVSAWLGELLAVTVTKSIVQRARPPEAIRLVVARGWSFPSGHTANAVVVFATFAALLSVFVRATAVRALIWGLAFIMVALVGFSRVELGAHWTTDVVSGAVWATCWVAMVVALVKHPLGGRVPTPSSAGATTLSHPGQGQP